MFANATLCKCADVAHLSADIYNPVAGLQEPAYHFRRVKVENAGHSDSRIPL